MSVNQMLTGLLMLLCASDAQADAKSRPYVAPEMQQFFALERGFLEAFSNNTFASLGEFYQHERKRGFELLQSKEALGWGKLILHPAAEQPVFIQVPHRYHDKWTLNIADHWLASGQFRAVMANNVHRHAGKLQNKGVNSDFSTALKSPLLAATRAFLKHYPEGKVIQLHGYSKAKRKDQRAKTSDIILSHGTKLAKNSLTELKASALCIQRKLGIKALVYPLQVNELGGTRNLISQEFRKRGEFERFIHLELSMELRQKLRNNSELSIKLIDCITGAVE